MTTRSWYAARAGRVHSDSDDVCGEVGWRTELHATVLQPTVFKLLGCESEVLQHRSGTGKLQGRESAVRYSTCCEVLKVGS